MQKKVCRLLLLLLLASVLLGCACSNRNEQANDPVSQTPEPSSNNVTLTLYFSDDQAQFLEMETREVEIENEQDEVAIATAVLNELIAGPSSENLFSTIPATVTVRDLKIEDGMAIIDFSGNIQASYGSASEYMAISSIANSLTELDYIDSIQILIEGEKVGTLAGHFDLSQPVLRDEDAIKK